MRATTLQAPFVVQVQEVPDPVPVRPTDAVVKVRVGCVCGSDLWRYRGENDFEPGTTIGHECLGEVVAIGDEVRDFAVGDFVIVPFCHCDNTCPHCVFGMPSACVNFAMTRSGQAELARVSQADGTLVRCPDPGEDDRLTKALLSLSDVMPTGWHAAISAGVGPGHTTVVVGDGAVGLCAVLAAHHLGAERIIILSRHRARQLVAQQFGATHVIETRGDDAVARVMAITDGIGADSVLECVGTPLSFTQAFAMTRPGGGIGFVGIPHGVDLPLSDMFETNVKVAGGVAPVRKYLPTLLPMVLDGSLDPSPVFDQEVGLEDVALAYRAMDERTAIKVVVRP